MFTCCVPSTTPSFTTEMAKVAELCPAAMVTLAGTAASLVSLLLSAITSGCDRSPLRTTVADTVPTFSLVVAVLRFSFSACGTTLAAAAMAALSVSSRSNTVLPASVRTTTR